VAGDPAVMEFDRKFDAVVGRLVLMYYPDPVDAIRKLARHVRRGGLIIFQEFDMENARSFPTAPTFDRAVGWMKQTLSATNTRIQLGLEFLRGCRKSATSPQSVQSRSFGKALHSKAILIL
jgi:SAM-dependent methyltransferase